MTNLLFIGQHFPPGMMRSLGRDTRGRAGFSNHNFETALMRGFASRPDTVMRAITVPLQYSWPRSSSRLRIPRESYSFEGVPVRGVGYLNLPAFSMLMTSEAMTRAIREEIEKFEGEDVYIVINTPLLPVGEALRRLKGRVSKRIHTTLIVPDIPSCVASMAGMGGLKGRVMGHINSRAMSLAREYDRYVFLTGAMNDFFNVPADRFMVMEGLVEPTPQDDAAEAGAAPGMEGRGEGEPDVVLYTGSLFEVFGVMRLVEAFLAGNFRNAELRICGSGDTAGNLRAIAARHPSVKFLGLLGAEETRKLQRRAAILANPRPAGGEYTRYSFPSKTLEYLAAGKPVVMNRLPGIPEEYDPYVVYPADESPRAWTEALRRLLEMTPRQREAIGEAGRRFVTRCKTPQVQTGRIMDFITSATTGKGNDY
ncbi:MAG: glycosyltransferase [Muribaculaceae bacterium]|nr:glycosyltransferase [Muribaculaceae bacterium]